MIRRVVPLALVQLASPVLGVAALRCDWCEGLERIELLPIATAELPWLAVLAQTRAASEPWDAIAGLAFLSATVGLAALTAWWLATGRRRVGAVALAGWVGWWTVALPVGAELHFEREHEHPCCC